MKENSMNTPNVAGMAGIAAGAKAGALRGVVLNHLRYAIGKDPRAATLSDWRVALSRAMRDLVVDPWFETTRRIYQEDRKRVYYLSIEYLIGRLLEDAVVNLGLDEAAREAMASLDVDYDAMLADEPDAALGNGGLGRLAACFLDSMSTVGIAAYGYGIRYDHGLFRQGFNDGWQTEEAETWLQQAHVWEFERSEVTYPVGFGGGVDGGRWTPRETVLAAAYDTPVPGWRARWVNTLRLWSAQSVREFDLAPFNRGDFVGAVAPTVLAQTISRVLYPDDSTPQGKELRLKQEYFFVAASLADILRRFRAQRSDFKLLPSALAIQINDTHPALAVPELIRLLSDQHGLDFEDAFEIARGCLNYTNHTLLPEALEHWPIDLFASTLPRHLELIEKIEASHTRTYRPPVPIRLVGDGVVRMGDLAFVGAHRVNGVSALHTELMKKTVFKDLHALHPDRIVNETNGITPRRWLHTCNRPLAGLITEAIGEQWVFDLDRLQALAPLVGDPGFQDRFAAAKLANKRRLAEWLETSRGIRIDTGALFDVHIKRIHEYKRQLLNILEAAALWNAIRRDPDADWTARVKFFGGKAAPGYAMAKLIIKLINDIGRTINADPLMRGRLQIVYPANYNVTMAELLIPAADLSEQISTAGMEASGTGNMKLALNGALTVGTLDGANVEIREAVGEGNIFTFGLTAEEVAERRASGFDPGAAIAADPRLGEVIEQIASGAFSPDDPGRYGSLIDALRHHDYFLVTADFAAYFDTQRRIDVAWQQRRAWNESTIVNVAHMGPFSSDRTIRGYARDVWGVEPVH
jgi:glycogen phosphorylase